jgi:hypothetical protein
MFKRTFSIFIDVKTAHKLTTFFVVLFVAAAGTYLLVSGHAASPYISTTATIGTLTSGASQQTCAGAAIGSCVVFGSSHSIPMDGSVALALSSPGTPFSPTSFWNTPLPDDTPVNPNNAAYSSDITYDLQNYYGTPEKPNNGALNTSSYSSPLYVVPADQPYVAVQPYCSNGQPVYASFANVLAGGVPIPADARSAVGTDEAIQIYQPSTNTYWDFWRLQKDNNGSWEACWGGVIHDVSQSDGIFLPNLGTSASGLALMGSVVRIEELQRGQIEHVMSLSLPVRLSKNTLPANTPGATAGFSWPADRSDGRSTNPLEIAEGQRFRLPPNLDLAQYDLSSVAMTIAVAAQKYGFVVRDGAGAVAIDLGDPTTYTNTPSPNLPDPYTTGPGVGGVGSNGLFDGVASYLIMKNFPWDQLEALPYNYGEPASNP